MGQVTDELKRIYLDEETNCAESLLKTALKSRNVKVPNACYRMMSGYSGGVSVEGMCGAVLGGVAALSLLLNQGDEESFERSKEAVAEFYQLCEDAYGSVCCHEIKTQWRTEEMRCFQVVCRIGEALETVLQNYGK